MLSRKAPGHKDGGGFSQQQLQWHLLSELQAVAYSSSGCLLLPDLHWVNSAGAEAEGKAGRQGQGQEAPHLRV